MIVSRVKENEKIRAGIAKTAAELHLPVLAAYDEIVERKCSFDHNLLKLLEAQARDATNRSAERKVFLAKFPQVKKFNTLEITQQRYPYADIEEMKNLQSCKFIENKLDVLATGRPGCGKTHTALAVGYEAAKKGCSVLYKTSTDLLLDMKEIESSGKKTKAYFRKISKCGLLILDMIGQEKLDARACSFLLEIIALRYENASTFYASCEALPKWPDFITNRGLALSIIDRISHHSIILNLDVSKSWRLEHAHSKGNKNQ
jgi:DNA replication protein DnaC